MHEACLLSQLSVLKKLTAINNNKYLYCLILTLSGDIILNTWLVYDHHPPKLKEWDIFKIKGLHLLHVNVNCLPPQIDQHRYIAKRSKSVVIGIMEPNIDNCVLDQEIQIDNYQILRCDRNEKGGGVAFYVRNDLNYVKKEFFPEEIENIFLDFTPKN